MKKFIFIVNALEIIAGLVKGEKFEGVLYLDKDTHVLTFKAWKRKAPKHPKQKKICDLDGGWLGETDKHYVRHEKFAKSLGLKSILMLLERDHHQSEDAIISCDLIDNA